MTVALSDTGRDSMDWIYLDQGKQAVFQLFGSITSYYIVCSLLLSMVSGWKDGRVSKILD
jgi:hypothetical protein